MKTAPSLYKGFRFPGTIISHCVYLYYRFPLSFRDVEEMMAARGVTVSYETIRTWCERFGRHYAGKLRQTYSKGSTHCWHLDECCLVINGQRQWLWRAVDQEGTVLDILVQPKRDKGAARRFFRKLLCTQGTVPRTVVTDKLPSYIEPCISLLPGAEHVREKGANNRAENSHQPTRIRERRMRRFKSASHAQRFLSIFEVVHNTFSLSRHALSAASTRTLRQRRFSDWANIAGTASGN